MKAELPKSEKEFLSTLSGAALRVRVRALHVEAGWPLSAIGAALTPPRSRSTIHSWTTAPIPHPPTPSLLLPILLPLPLPLPLPLKSIAAAEKSTSTSHLPKRERRVYNESAPALTEDERLKISQLSPLAQRYRARANPTGAYALANEELTELCIYLHRRGATVRELAEAAGVTYRAMARRIGR